ncbi:MAG: ABC transporter ATP-binding protein [Actinobacteria bacterium]|nr:ABC transporter ATP-binding protein [Actinomycetota bacterium]
MTAAVECRNVSVAYGANTVLDSIDLAVADGETLGLLGPSGSGKTTLLLAIAGFVPLQTGEIEIKGQVVSGPRQFAPPERRALGMVFQNYALWPHLDAADTVAYPLRRAGIEKREARRQAIELLSDLELSDLAGRKPSELSGGQQQRVGLARALARKAAIFLFDEPTAHLDAAIRQAVTEEIARRRAEHGTAAIFSTHDAAEALAASDRVAILRSGRLVQIGTPRQVYEEPFDLWSARLTGPASLVGDDIVRPEWVVPGSDLKGTVIEVWYRGTHTDYTVSTEAGPLYIRLLGPPQLEVGAAQGWTISRSWHPHAGAT